MADLFQDKAQNWDAQESIKKLSEGIAKTLLAQIKFDKTMHVMDFGAGTGLLSTYVAPLVQKIWAVDISPAMLEQLLNKPELQGKVEIYCQNILEIPLKHQFDVIISAMAMHHVKDIAALIQCFADHLKSAGKIGLADLDREDGSFHPPDTEGVFHTGFDRHELKGILEKSGFEKIQFLTAHHVIKNGREYPIFLVTAQKS